MAAQAGMGAQKPGAAPVARAGAPAQAAMASAKAPGAATFGGATAGLQARATGTAGAMQAPAQAAMGAQGAQAARGGVFQQQMSPSGQVQQPRAQAQEPWAAQRAMEGATPVTGGAVSLEDVAGQAFADVEAQKAQKMETRAIAEQALGAVQGAYGTAIDEMTGHVGEAREILRGEGAAKQEAAGERFQQAWDVAEDAKARAEQAAVAQTGRAEAWREEGLEKMTSQFALRADALRRGMSTSYDRRMADVDDMVAQGRITGQGGMNATQLAAGLKQQVQNEYQDQLRAQSSQLAVEEGRVESQMRSAMDQYSLASIGQAQQMAAGAGVSIAGTVAQLAAAEANSHLMWEVEDRNRELGLLQFDLSIEQLRVREPELAAEIRLSSAYLPDAVVMYPLVKELYDMYEIADERANQQRQQLNQVFAQGGMTPATGTPFGRWQPGGEENTRPVSQAKPKVQQPWSKPAGQTAKA